jgi:hypothetical protein
MLLSHWSRSNPAAARTSIGSAPLIVLEDHTNLNVDGTSSEPANHPLLDQAFDDGAFATTQFAGVEARTPVERRAGDRSNDHLLSPSCRARMGWLTLRPP